MYEIRVLCFASFLPYTHSDEESHKRDWKNSEHHPVKRAKSRSLVKVKYSEFEEEEENYAKQSHRRSTSAMSAAQITSYMLKL